MDALLPRTSDRPPQAGLSQGADELRAFVVDTGLGMALVPGATSALLGADASGAVTWTALVWLMYLTDRMSGGPEDEGRMPWPLRHRRLAGALGLTLAAAVAIGMVLQPHMLLGTVTLVAIGATYFVPVPGLGRAKELPGFKAAFVASCLAGGVVLVAGAPMGWGVVSFWCLMHANASIYDVRDQHGDRAAGLSTLPVLLTARDHSAVQAAFVLVALVAGWGVGGGYRVALIPIALLYLFICHWLETRPFPEALSIGLDGATALLLLAPLAA